MGGDVQRYSNRRQAGRFSDRGVSKQKRQATDEVLLAEHRVRCHFALAGKIMEHADSLDDYRHDLADGDRVLNAVLSEIEATALMQAKREQRGLFGNRWP